MRALVLPKVHCRKSEKGGSPLPCSLPSLSPSSSGAIVCTHMSQQYEPNYNHHNPQRFAGNRISKNTSGGVPASHQWGSRTGSQTTSGLRAFTGSVRVL